MFPVEPSIRRRPAKGLLDFTGGQRLAYQVADLVRAAHRLAVAFGCRLDLLQFFLRRLDQLLALARPLAGQQRVAADNEPLPRIIRVSDFS